jgi:uncharacterized RDD family membrane protein YckC
MHTETELQQPADLFTDDDAIQYEEASTGQRLLNLIIDVLVLNYGVGLLTGFAFGMLLLALSPESAERFVTGGLLDNFLLYYLLGSINYLLYYTFCEKVFGGRTLGKLITGTRALRNDGGALTLKDAFLRSLCRIVPFEPFSALGGYPWHDRWTNTMVVKTR